MDLRTTLHQAGAAILEQLLEYAEPGEGDLQVACSCGRMARYLELREKTLMTVVGETKLRRPYYLCAHCHTGQFHADRELDAEGTGKSPGVRRILAGPSASRCLSSKDANIFGCWRIWISPPKRCRS
jgi:hypothetical protein